jgi:TetR/AcrR family transcriptional regulator, cholesterol catabolism regulator
MSQHLRREVRKIRVLVDDAELVVANRRKLIDAATDLFRVKGFDNTSTKDIAEKAGISVGAIYQYILKKEDLVVLILSSVVEIYEQTVYPLAAAPGSAQSRLWRAVDVYYRTLDEHHAKTDVLYHNFSGFDPSTKSFLSQIEERISGIFTAIIEQGVTCGEFAAVNATFVAHNITSMAHMWALKRGRLRRRMSIDEYISNQLMQLDAVLRERK